MSLKFNYPMLETNELTLKVILNNFNNKISTTHLRKSHIYDDKLVESNKFMNDI